MGLRKDQAFLVMVVTEKAFSFLINFLPWKLSTLEVEGVVSLFLN